MNHPALHAPRTSDLGKCDVRVCRVAVHAPALERYVNLHVVVRLSGRQASISRVFGRFGGISPSSQRMRLAHLASALAISLFAVSLSMRLHASARSWRTCSCSYRAGHGGHFGRVGRFCLISPSAPCARFAHLASENAKFFSIAPSCSRLHYCTGSAAAASIGYRRAPRGASISVAFGGR